MSTFPTIFEWLERLDFLRGLPAAYLGLLAAAVITVIWDWRAAILALAVQYLAVGLLYVEVLDPRLAMVKFLVGIFICLILYFTARQAGWGSLPPDLDKGEALQWQRKRPLRFGPYLSPGSLPFRLLLTLLLVVVVIALSGRPGYQLPAAPPAVNLAVYALVALGLINASITGEPLRSGIGLLLVLSGFELFYNTLEQSIVMLAFLAGANLALALAVAYLTQARHALRALLD
jgi:hypothetical protein